MNLKVRQLKVKISSVRKLKTDFYLLGFDCPYLARKSQPGNFLHIKVDKTILRRPFSVHKVQGSKVYILFKLKGRGTKILARAKKGGYLDVIGPLGEGFKVNSKTKNILLAGGIGVAPLVFLAEKLKGSSGLVLLGAKDKKEILCENEFKKLGFKVQTATDDGSKGYKGSVTIHNSCLAGRQAQFTIHDLRLRP